MSRISYYLSHFFQKIDVGLIFAALLTLFIAQSLLKPGLPVGGDFAIHLYRTMEFERAWSAGVIVPRWSPNLAYGFGYPLFVFAPPLPYVLILSFHWLGLDLEAAFKAFLILTIALYATGMYLLARDLLGSVGAALVAATASAFAPFALREAILYGGNVPQFLAAALFPWTLWALTRVACTRSWWWVIVAALFYAGIMLSHLFIILIFTPVAGLYSLILFWLSLRYGATSPGPSTAGPITRIITSALPLFVIPLGLLLSAFFWIPVFVERLYTRAQADIYMARSPYYNRFPYWTDLVAWIYPLDIRAANPYVPLTLGVVTLVLAGLGLLAGLWLVTKRQPAARGSLPRCRLLSTPTFIFFFGGVAAVAIFLALPVSRPVWDSLTVLQVAEFPWRLLSLANLGLAFLAGAALLLPPPRFRLPLAVACLVVQILTVAPFLYPVVPFAQYQQATIADQIRYERSSQAIGTTGLGEYLPLTVTQVPTTSLLVETYQAGQIPERLDRDSLPENATATLLEQTAVTHIYQLNSLDDFTLRLFQFDYPGWRAWLDSQPVPIVPEPDTGLILVDVPAGDHRLQLQFGETPTRVLAMGLTTGTVVLTLMFGLYLWRKEPPVSLVAETGPPSLPAASRLVLLAGALLVVVLALWVKPAMRPFFTVHSPPGQILPAQHKTDIQFDLGIRLAGYDLQKSVVTPGDRLQVVLYWETDRAPIRANLQPFVHLDRLNDGITVADATNYVPGDVTAETNMPTFHWDTARYVRDEHDLDLAPDTPPLAYAVRVGLIDPEQNRLLPLAGGSGDTAQIATINVTPPFGQQVRLDQPVDVSLSGDGDTLRLTGYQLNEQATERLDFTLAWESDQTPHRDYTVFAQLLDQDQHLVTSFDGPPLDGAYPTSTWLSGQTIADPRHIPLEDVPQGEYRLIVGVYDPQTQKRLITDDGADFVELTSVNVAR